MDAHAPHTGSRQDRPAAIGLIEAIRKAKPHPEQGFRSCLGILRLVKSYGAQRLEAACRRGNDISATTYGSIARSSSRGSIAPLTSTVRRTPSARHRSGTPTFAGEATTTEHRETIMCRFRVMSPMIPE